MTSVPGGAASPAVPAERYRGRILALLVELIGARAPVATALDFGSGDGFYARGLRAAGIARELVPVDVVRRRTTFVEPRIYDGVSLPFPDRSFELSYAVDVLHHCPDPFASLRELLRVTERWFLLKDHTYSSRLGFLTLSLMDELGNRRFGIPSRYRYQKGWEWFRTIERSGFVVERLVHPALCHERLPWRATNGLQFAALFRREGARD